MGRPARLGGRRAGIQVRAYQIATTLPKGPTYVCLDAALQETRLDNVPPPPPLARFAAADPPEPSAAALTAATTALATAKRPLVMIGRVSNSVDDWDRRVALVERIGARVLTDLRTAPAFRPNTRRIRSPPACSSAPTPAAQ